MSRKLASDDQPNEPDIIKPGEIVTSDKVSTKNQVSAIPKELKTPKAKLELADENTKQPLLSDESLSIPPAGNVTWTASEFIAHYKSAGWYILLAIVALAVSTGVWFVTKDKFSTALVCIGILLLVVYGAHKPRQLTYQLGDLGLTIGSSHHTFSEFRSFSIVSIGAFSSIELVPLKRFAMYTTVYFDPADEDKIIQVLSTHLPMEEPRNDPIDQLMHRLRF
jgi:hypothetical protein